MPCFLAARSRVLQNMVFRCPIGIWDPYRNTIAIGKPQSGDKLTAHEKIGLVGGGVGDLSMKSCNRWENLRGIVKRVSKSLSMAIIDSMAIIWKGIDGWVCHRYRLAIQSVAFAE